jgi:multisubunit Na+/H+ antiporter MnhC subunit
MDKKKPIPPWWLFALIAIGALIACGIYIGIMSVEGMKTIKLVEIIGFGLLGLLMFWGARNSR